MAKYWLRAIALGYVAVLVLVPLGLITARTVRQGWEVFWTTITSEQALTAFKLTAVITMVAVIANTVFGVGTAILLTRYRFPGKRALNAFIDVPISVSPIVVGLALILVYGPYNGWFGKGLHNAGIDVIFSLPGMVLATIFVSLPLVVREVVPVLEEAGIDQEQAARVLGASSLQRFRRITLPTIKWALSYGVVLTIARCIGEYGAVKVVSGNISGAGQTQTATLYVDEKIQLLEPGGYQVALVLIAVAIIAIVIVSLLRPKEHAL